MNNVKCELTGAVLHLQRQRHKSDPASKTRDRGTPSSIYTPAATPTNPWITHPPHTSQLQTPEPSTAEKTLLDLLPGATDNSQHHPPLMQRQLEGHQLRERRWHQTYSELAEQQAEHLQGGHGAVDPHIGHGPIRRCKHGGLHREEEVKAGLGTGLACSGPGHCQPRAVSAEQQVNGVLVTLAPDLTHRATYKLCPDLDTCGEAVIVHVLLRKTPAELLGQPLLLGLSGSRKLTRDGGPFPLPVTLPGKGLVFADTKAESSRVCPRLSTLSVVCQLPTFPSRLDPFNSST